MRLILARHGNTFNSSNEAYWVGRGEDLPLVSGGIAQAEAAAEALRTTRLDAVYAAPLLRTTAFGDIIAMAQEKRPDIHADERLSELDYGNWAGLNNDQIAALYPAEEMDDWGKAGIWPPSGNFSPPEDDIIAGIHSLTREIRDTYGPDGQALCISSNGILRYFLTLIPGKLDEMRADARLKVKTGRICALDLEKGSARLLFWNARPEEAQDALNA